MRKIISFAIALILATAPVAFAVTPPVSTPLNGTMGAGTTPVPSAYGTPPVVNSTASQILECRFYNGTNQAITVSYDGTNPSLTSVLPGAVEWDDLGANGITKTGPIYIKSVSSTPSTGTFEINCKSKAASQ